MKKNSLFVGSFLLCLISISYVITVGAAAYNPLEEMALNHSDSLPPAEEMIGAIVTPEKVNNRGEEIQLAHGGCETTGSCQSYCKNNRGGHAYCDPNILVVPNPPIIPYIGNVCRGFLGFCYTAIPSPIGTPCHCISYTLFGLPYVWLQGTVSLF